MGLEPLTALKVKFTSVIIQPSSFVQRPVFKTNIKTTMRELSVPFFRHRVKRNVQFYRMGKAALNLWAIALC